MRHLEVLSVAYVVSISDDHRWLLIQNFRLPPGFSRNETGVLLEVPTDYPFSPPAVGSSMLYLPPNLRFKGRRLRDFHAEVNPGWGNWGWFCYEDIRWDPHRDDLVRFLEMVRQDLTDPNTW